MYVYICTVHVDYAHVYVIQSHVCMYSHTNSYMCRKEDIKPEQYHKIKLYLSQPLSDESERNNFLLQTLQGMFV